MKPKIPPNSNLLQLNVANSTLIQVEAWLAEMAVIEMKKSGPYEDLRATATNLGPFKLEHVSFMRFSSFT